MWFRITHSYKPMVSFLFRCYFFTHLTRMQVSRDNVASSGAKISERIWKEPVEAWLETVFRHLFGVTEENHNVPQDFRYNSQDSNGEHPEQETEELWLGSCSALPRYDHVNVNI
jgi:hypothetical protein